MANLIDLSPHIQTFKQMSGVTIMQRFVFFDGVGAVKDITGYNFRMLGTLKETGQPLTESVFSSEVLNSSISNRNGLFLRENTTNELIFLYDFITDTSLFNLAAEGTFIFKLIMTDPQGIDSCLYVLSYDCKQSNVSEIASTAYVAQVVNVTIAPVTCVFNITIQTLI